ncbi:MAG: sporulation membrane protein YtaF [Oscillospiraceae bacterium]|nr:sporulation membrane protein YtaF [Oscillospiraceae bacterium]
MIFLLREIIQAALLVTALSTDALVAGFSYGVNNVKIPLKSALVINAVCGALLALSIFFGTLLNSVMPPGTAAGISFTLLFGLGLIKLFDGFIKRMIKSGKAFGNFKFKLLNLNFILHVYAEPEQADIDASRILSPKEAVTLAAALSLDGLSVGFGVGLVGANPLLVVGLSRIFDFAAIMLGVLFGRRVADKLSIDLSWLSGVLLIVLAVLRLT